MSLLDPNDMQEEVLDEEFIDYNTDPDTTCTICQAEFLDAEDLTIHLQQIHNISDGCAKQCQFCSSSYTDLIAYAEHLRDKHIVNLKYCEYCLRAFNDFDEHRYHEKQHGHKLNKPSYNCTQCEKKFGNIYDLRKHDFECHRNNYDGVQIQQYLPYLSAVLNIKAVTLLQSLHTDTVFICVGCEYSTADIACFIKHAKSNRCTKFVCDKCSNVYKKKYNLKRHMAVKDCSLQPSAGKIIICPECNLTFSRYGFRKHKKNCKVIKCSTCGIRFESMYELSEHQSKEHPLSVELKACTFCWKQCVGNVALQKHIDRSHKSELHLYKYQCVYCKSAYKHPQKLFGHFFSKHRLLEPYTCKICDKKFRLRKKFTLHIKLEHKSVGFVEFDENYHVFFDEKKSQNPFIPKSLYADQPEEQKKDTTHNVEDSSDIGLLNMNSEMSVTETEGNQTEAESKPKPKLKRKRVPKAAKETEEPIAVESSDDEPLLVVKKRVQKSMPKILRNRWTKKQLTSINKKRLTCSICNKYCYTYQNYNHHVSLHSNRDYKKCIKCSEKFRSKEKLNNHIATDHSTSRLTETLKTMLEKRKNGQNITDDLPMSERFRRTIKKVKSDGVQTTATITAVENGQSLQNFIENFTPETEIKPEARIEHAVSLKLVTGSPKQPTIKMTKFEPKPISNTLKLSMPVKFKDCYPEKHHAKIRLVQPTSVYNDDSNDHDYNNYPDDVPDTDRNDSIPEVAEEVMLEGTEETPKAVPIPHKIVIPKLPMEYKDIRIAHLLPQAPYYKIVKVNDVLNMQNIEKCDKEDTDIIKTETIKLPDGTKLVNTNPLAHLLGKTSVENVLKPIKNKYYKPKVKDFQGMLAEALSNLDKPPVRKKKKEQDSQIPVGQESPMSATP